MFLAVARLARKGKLAGRKYIIYGIYDVLVPVRGGDVSLDQVVVQV